jgi:site-specific recombinase XerD
MKSQPSLARHLESFFHQRLTKQRNATRATVTAYRDALRLLVLFASEQTGKEPCALAVEDIDRDMILAYLDHLERSRGNGVHTRNARLTAIRSFFRHVAASDPALIGVAQRVLSIPCKKSDVPTTRYLSRAELDALLDAPSRIRCTGAATEFCCCSSHVQGPGSPRPSVSMRPTWYWTERAHRSCSEAKVASNV